MNFNSKYNNDNFGWNLTKKAGPNEVFNGLYDITEGFAKLFRGLWWMVKDPICRAIWILINK